MGIRYMDHMIPRPPPRPPAAVATGKPSASTVNSQLPTLCAGNPSQLLVDENVQLKLTIAYLECTNEGLVSRTKAQFEAIVEKDRIIRSLQESQER